MMKTITYFFLLFTLFFGKSYALDLKQGLYSFNGGLSNKKSNTKKFVYGPGFRYRYSEDLDITSLGLKHHFLHDVHLSYGLENYETMRLGIKYPFYLRGEKNFKFTSLDVQLYLSDRYFPEFYSEDTLHFLSTGISFKEKMTDELTLQVGGELHRLYNREQIFFANLFYALEKLYRKKYFMRLEYSDTLNNGKVPHVHDWVSTATVGLIF